MSKYLEPWVATKECLPEEGQEVFAKKWKSPEEDRFLITHCIFKKEWGVHKDAFVVQESPPEYDKNSRHGWVAMNIICWMPAPPHGDANGEEWRNKEIIKDV